MSLEKTFPIYKKSHKSGNVGFRVDMGKIGKKRIFKSFPDEESAKRFQTKCLQAEAKKKPVDLRDLDDLVRHEVLTAPMGCTSPVFIRPDKADDQQP